MAQAVLSWSCIPRVCRPHAFCPQRFLSSAGGTGGFRRMRRPPPPPPAFSCALVGRPNVGKSTLFNRLVKRRAAIVSPVRGTTRDRQEGLCRVGDLCVRIVDTGGLEELRAVSDASSLDGQVFAQAHWAVANSEVLLFLVDAREGVTSEDHRYATWLLRSRAGSDVPVSLVVNKAEGQRGGGGALDLVSPDLYAECVALGLGEPLAISAEHGEGISALYDLFFAQSAARQLDMDGDTEDTEDVRDGQGPISGGATNDDPVTMSIIGRPNVGKSTLLNRLAGSARAVVGPEPGVTRDAVAHRMRVEAARGVKREVVIVDTAGVKRRAGQQPASTRRVAADMVAIDEAALKVAVVVVDAADVTAFAQPRGPARSAPRSPLSKTEMSLVGAAVDEGRALVIAANKCDLVGSGLSQATAHAEDSPMPHHDRDDGQGGGDDYTMTDDGPCPPNTEDLDDWGRAGPRSSTGAGGRAYDRISRTKLAAIVGDRVANAIPGARGAPVVAISARDGTGVETLIKTAIRCRDRWMTTLDAQALNDWLYAFTRVHPPPPPKRGWGGAHIYHIEQTGTGPPAFKLVADQGSLPEGYMRFFSRQLREEFRLHGTSLRVTVRKRQRRQRRRQRGGGGGGGGPRGNAGRRGAGGRGGRGGRRHGSGGKGRGGTS